MHPSQRLDGVQEYYFARKLREIDELNAQGKQILNLGIGSPDLPPHPTVIQALADSAVKPNVHGYQGYKGIAALRKAYADWYQKIYSVTVAPDTEILPLIGSKEGILHISMAFLNPGDKVLVPNPGYPTYQAATKLAGGICVPYELKEQNDWEPDFDELQSADLSGVKLMWINFPHMPTGKLPDAILFAKLVQFAKQHGILLCHDNPYSLILNNNPMSIFSVPDAKDIALELNSLSKSHNMAGWRIGALFGKAELINTVMRFRSNMDSGTFLPMQMAAVTALGLGDDWYTYNNAIYQERRDYAAAILKALGCSFSTNQGGMFMWAKIPAGQADGFQFTDTILQNARVFLTPGGIFGSAGNNFIRISLCSPVEKLTEALTRIKAVL